MNKELSLVPVSLDHPHTQLYARCPAVEVQSSWEARVPSPDEACISSPAWGAECNVS